MNKIPFFIFIIASGLACINAISSLLELFLFSFPLVKEITIREQFHYTSLEVIAAIVMIDMTINVKQK